MSRLLKHIGRVPKKGKIKMASTETKPTYCLHDDLYLNCSFNVMLLLAMLTRKYIHRLTMPFSLCIPKTAFADTDGSNLFQKSDKYVKIKYPEPAYIITIGAPFRPDDILGRKNSFVNFSFSAEDFSKTTQEVFDEVCLIIDYHPDIDVKDLEEETATDVTTDGTDFY